MKKWILIVALIVWFLWCLQTNAEDNRPRLINPMMENRWERMFWSGAKLFWSGMRQQLSGFCKKLQNRPEIQKIMNEKMEKLDSLKDNIDYVMQKANDIKYMDTWLMMHRQKLMQLEQGYLMLLENCDPAQRDKLQGDLKEIQWWIKQELNKMKRFIKDNPPPFPWMMPPPPPFPPRRNIISNIFHAIAWWFIR